MRRAISCEYCPPKSRTRTVWPTTSGSGAEEASTALGSGRVAAETSVIRGGYRLGNSRASVGAHADSLLALELLALGLEGRRDHHLGALEVADVLVAAGGHGGPQGAHQVEGAVVFVSRAEEDLLERAVLLGRDARAARQRWMKRRHAPVESAARRLLRTRQRRADHHGVGAACDRLGDVAAGAHAAVGDDVAVLARFQHVLSASRRDVGDRRRLRNADPEDAAGGACRAGADADEHANRAGTHEVESRGEGGAAADHAGDGNVRDELLEVQRHGAGGHVLRRDHRALDDEDVEAGLERYFVVLDDALWRERSCCNDALCLDLLDSPG